MLVPVGPHIFLKRQQLAKPNKSVQYTRPRRRRSGAFQHALLEGDRVAQALHEPRYFLFEIAGVEDYRSVYLLQKEVEDLDDQLPTRTGQLLWCHVWLEVVISQEASHQTLVVSAVHGLSAVVLRCVIHRELLFKKCTQNSVSPLRNKFREKSCVH